MPVKRSAPCRSTSRSFVCGDHPSIARFQSETGVISAQCPDIEYDEAMAYLLFRYLHLIAAVVFAGALIIKNFAIGRLISQQDANNLAWLSTLSLLSGPVIAGCGTALWFWTGKPAAFYSENPVFYVKIGLFLVLLSCLTYTAVFFNRHRKTSATEITVPFTIRLSLRCAMLCLALIPILAWAVARGLGLSPS